MAVLLPMFRQLTVAMRLAALPEEAQRELQNVFEMIAEEYAERGAPLPQDVELTIAHAR